MYHQLNITLLLYLIIIFFIIIILSNATIKKKKKHTSSYLIEKEGEWNIIVSNEYQGKASKQICPFPRLNANMHTFQDVRDKCFMMQQPCIIENVMNAVIKKN